MAHQFPSFHLFLFFITLTAANLRLISTIDSPSPPPPQPPPPLPLPPTPLSTSTIPPPLPPPSSPSVPKPPSPLPPPTPSSSPAISPLPPPHSPPPPPEFQDQQLNNIIDALLGSGDFAGWMNILFMLNISTLPLSGTFFIPGNFAISAASSIMVNFDPLTIPYHILPQRLLFSQLQSLPTNTRLPTLLPTKSILITNNSQANFTVDDAPVTDPDVYVNPSFAVHGIGSVLDYTLYGGNSEDQPPFPPYPVSGQPPPPEPVIQDVSGISDAACSCIEFPIVLSVVCAAFAFKIHRNLLILLS